MESGNVGRFDGLNTLLVAISDNKEQNMTSDSDESALSLIGRSPGVLLDLV